MKQRRYSRFRFGLVLGIGAVVAAVLCVQCVRTCLYLDAVLVPQQAEREAERQAGALAAAARSAKISDLRALGPVMEHALEASAERVLWMRVLDAEGKPLAEGGKPEGTAKIPVRYWERVERHESLGAVAETAQGKVLVAMLPFRLPRAAQSGPPSRHDGVPPVGHRPPGFVLELAIPLRAVAGAFDGLKQNLIVGVVASIALLLSLAMIALRTRHYLRGKYLESELQLASRVQLDLQPKPHSMSPLIDFAASSMAADQIGGDFYDIFEADSGKIAIVLGDVSGKGIPAALLVSLLQGAIRSSTAAEHEYACERINRMLCERTAGGRFATLFWGVFDPASSTLRYVNAGHAAPMLIRRKTLAARLDEGGPVLGLLPTARYAAGTVEVESSDTLILYSDGIDEATNQNEEEFGEERLREIIADNADTTPGELCGRILKQVTAFASATIAPDDRTLLVVRFRETEAALEPRKSREMGALTAA